MCHHASESVGFRNLPRSLWGQWCPYKERGSRPDRVPAIPMTQDLKLIGILTGTKLDCGPQTSKTSPPLRRSVIAVKLSGRGERAAGLLRSWTSDENTSKCMSKCYFWGLCQKFKTIRKTFLLEQVFKKNKVLISFPAIWGQNQWGQIQQGQLWPYPVQLGKFAVYCRVRMYKNKLRFELGGVLHAKENCLNLYGKMSSRAGHHAA